MRYPDRVHIREVTARDGLQAEPTLVSTANKVRLVDLLSVAGFPQINVTSFVRADAVPQMSDCVDVMARITRRPGVVYDATVPNLKGAQRAIAAGADAIVVFVAASDTASREGVNRSTQDAMHGAEAAVAAARAVGLQAVGTISSAFGSPYGDDVAAGLVLNLVDRFVQAGVTSVALGDTSGEGNPRQVHNLVTRVLEALPSNVSLSLHFHDTRGLGLANVIAALDAGAVQFDSAVGGLGGSPFTKNSSGNVATEELVFMCEAMGVDTGIDHAAILEAHALLETWLQHALPSKLGRLLGTEAARHA